jgi:hypothetical protein
MTDWKVKIRTDTGYIKDVVVHDYNYPQDAVDAALSQTGASDYVSYEPHFENGSEYYSSKTIQQNYRKGSYVSTNSSAEFEFVCWMTLGLLFVMISIPIAFILFSIMAIRLAMSK